MAQHAYRVGQSLWAHSLVGKTAVSKTAIPGSNPGEPAENLLRGLHTAKGDQNLIEILSVLKKLGKSLKTFVGEYKLVTWPTPSAALNLSIFVLIVSVIITLIILGLDTFFFELRSFLIF